MLGIALTATLSAAAAAPLQPASFLPQEEAAFGPDTPLVVPGIAANEIRLGDGTLIHSTSMEISALERVEIPGSNAVVVRWTESDGAYSESSYRLRLEGNSSFGRVRPTVDTMHLQHGTFDPLTERQPKPLRGYEANGELYMVQFVTQSIEAYEEALRAEGATIWNYMPAQGRLVQMDEETAATIAELPFVRWVGPYHASYRLEPFLKQGLENGTLGEEPLRIHIQVLEKGLEMKERVAAKLDGIGAPVVSLFAEGYRLDAMLTPAQLAAVTSWDEVLWVDRWSPMEEDMDRVRVDGGANALESVAGFTGTGVRGEALDGNVDPSHPELQSNPVLIHGPTGGSATHGTPVTGIVFGDGSLNGARRGLLPDGQPIFGDSGNLLSNTGARYSHTAELLQPPYNAVFQTNSTGSARTTIYNSTSAAMDDLLFDHDIVILQSQSNAGNTDSRPQAWAKNVVGVGGIRHQDTQTLNDDAWANSGSIGPAQDGRIKPDLSYWYDSIFTIQSGGGSTQFGGTSAATPMTAGYFGLFFEMWHAGLFGNTPGATVFDSRPKATLARAIMINAANRYNFNGANADLTRVHQGWGRASAINVYDDRDKIFWINETDVLQETESIAYGVVVEPNTPELVATMVYLEPMGTTSSSLHRINDLSMRVTAPGGQTSYWGNNGLTISNVSTPGGSSNTKDPIEVVIIPNPAPGTWTIEIFADDINQDSHVETPQLDADFALAVRGVVGGGTPCPQPSVFCTGAPNSWSTLGARLTFAGTTSLAQNNAFWTVEGMSQNTFGVIFQGDQQVNVASGFGTLCVAGTTTRLAIVASDFFGLASWQQDLTATPNIMANTTWNYQCWFRDNTSGIPGFNYSDAVEVTWCE